MNAEMGFSNGFTLDRADSHNHLPVILTNIIIVIIVRRQRTLEDTTHLAKICLDAEWIFVCMSIPEDGV